MVMIVWSVHDSAGRCVADGHAPDAAEGWEQAAVVEVAGAAASVQGLVLCVGAQRARVYAGRGPAGPGAISFGAVVDDLVRAVGGRSATDQRRRAAP
jgi:hypothetical protein